MSCTCIRDVNAELRARNTVIITTLFRNPDVVVVSTDKIDSKVRGKPVVVIATYCPFCGNEYAAHTPTPEQGN